MFNRLRTHRTGKHKLLRVKTRSGGGGTFAAEEKVVAAGYAHK